MKPKNNEIIRKAYYQFSGYLMVCVALGVLIFYTFIKTSSVEVNKILAKTEEYDLVYVQEIDLANRVDSVLYYLSLLNSGPRINDLLLQSTISNQKMSLLNYMNSMDGKNCLVYKKVIGEMNVFLSSKDSIRMLSSEEEMARNELLRCVEDNRQAVRKLSVGGLTFNKN